MLDHGKLVLKNYLVNSVVELMGVPLAAATARARNRFILLFSDQVKFLENKRLELLKQYGELDTEGNLQIGEDGKYKMTDHPGFTKAYEEFMEAVYELPCRAEQLVDFNAAYQILSTLETKLSVQQTGAYEEIMQAFEAWKSNGTE